MTFRLACADFAFPLLPHAEVFALIKSLGLQGVDIGLFPGRSHFQHKDFLGREAQAARELSAKVHGQGLEFADLFLQSGSSLEDLAENHPDPEQRRQAREVFLRGLELTARCNAAHMTSLPGILWKQDPPGDSLRRCSEELAWRVEQARGMGVVYSIEPHTWSIVPTPEATLGLVRMTPGLTLSLDFSHFTGQGIPDERILPLIKHTSHFHARCATKGMIQAPLKKNTIDFAAILRTMASDGYKGWLALEYVRMDNELVPDVDNLSETILLRELLRKVVGMSASPPTIKSITAHPLQYPEPHDHGKLRYITLARVESSDGAVGWGECISQFPESALATKTIIEQGYAPLLVGDDPREVERTWHKMLARVWWYGPQGIAAFALSAVDMALWDLKGKLLGLPVCNLIGGRLREKVSAMASIHLDMDNLNWSVREFTWFREQGYRIVKGGWGKKPESVFGLSRSRDIELTRLVREAIGPDLELVFDVLGARVRWDVATATQRLRDLEPYRLFWIEEPLPPQDYDAHRRLRAAVPGTRVGTGEQEWDLEGYRRLIDAGGVDIVQMDPGRCHGITGCRNVARLVETRNLQFTAHTWSSALNTAASVHLLASSRAGLTMDFKPHESPMQHELVSDPWVQQGGFIAVRDTPGLGVTVREEIVAKYRFGG